MYYLDPDTKNVITYDYFGGNIQGIKEKLSYLKDLGISVIYFNPILNHVLIIIMIRQIIIK